MDTLADITQGTHPRPGDQPQHYTFMQAFYPYVLLYIAAYFFQGGTGGGSVGLLSNLRQYLWIPITQNAYRCTPRWKLDDMFVKRHGTPLLTRCLAASRQCCLDAHRRISLDLFTHMLDLDLNFHLHRKTGEVIDTLAACWMVLCQKRRSSPRKMLQTRSTFDVSSTAPTSR